MTTPRLAVRCRAVAEASGPQAWTTFCQAAGMWGLPVGVLSDNWLSPASYAAWKCRSNSNLHDARRRPFTGRPSTPSTTAKSTIPTNPQTMAAPPTPRRRPDAPNTQLDDFGHIHNHHRTHQGIGSINLDPRWTATPPSQPAGNPLPRPAWPTHHHTTSRLREGGTVRRDQPHLPHPHRLRIRPPDRNRLHRQPPRHRVHPQPTRRPSNSTTPATTNHPDDHTAPPHPIT